MIVMMDLYEFCIGTVLMTDLNTLTWVYVNYKSRDRNEFSPSNGFIQLFLYLFNWKSLRSLEVGMGLFFSLYHLNIT